MPSSQLPEPDLPMSPPDLRPAAAEVQRRIDLIRELVARRGAARARLSARRNFAWLTVGGQSHVVTSTDTGVAPIVIDGDSARVLAPVNEADRLATEELDGLPLEIERVPWEGGTDVRTDPAGGTLDDAALEQALVRTRALLREVEQARMAWLGERLTACLDAVAADLLPGVTEMEASIEIARRLSLEGIRAPVLLVAADERIDRYRHPLPSSAPIRRRAMLVAVGERWGLHVALTRMPELEAVAPELAHRRRAVDAVLRAMLAATAPGATLGSVFEAAQRAYAEAGVPDEWRLHHQGGLLGYQPRERLATPGDPTPLAAGMAVAWNPSITGAKVEASHLLTDDPGQLRALTRAESPSTESLSQRSAP
jgi:Xaa-Pro dipeptidase